MPKPSKEYLIVKVLATPINHSDESLCLGRTAFPEDISKVC